MHIILLLLMINSASQMFDAIFLSDYIKYVIQFKMNSIEIRS